MNLRGTTLTAAFAASFAGLVVAGCGGGDDKTTKTTAAKTTTAAAAATTTSSDPEAVTRSFLTALAAGDQGTGEQRQAACETLTDKARTSIEATGTKVGATDCVSTLLAIGKLAGPTQLATTKTMAIDVTTSGDSATATYAAPNDGSPQTVQLVRDGDGWSIDSLG